MNLFFSIKRRKILSTITRSSLQKAYSTTNGVFYNSSKKRFFWSQSSEKQDELEKAKNNLVKLYEYKNGDVCKKYHVNTLILLNII